MAEIFASIARKDRLELFRDNRLRLAMLLVVILSLAAVTAAYVRIADAERDRAAATATERSSWLNMGARDPHAAAHFSQWTFRPVEGAALLDPGVTPYTGSAIWLEAHLRNPAAFRPIEDRTTILDLGELSASWVLQTLGPLLAFLLAAGLVARERERGTLRLMIASGAQPTWLVSAKARGLLFTILLATTPVFIAAVAAVILSPSESMDDMLLRTLLWVLVHVLWLALVVLIGVVVSASTQSTSRALVLLVSLWILVVPLAPRTAASIAEALHPTPSGARFWAKARGEVLNGVNPDESYEKRQEVLKERLLRQYGVSRIEDLPISFRGVWLEESERFGSHMLEQNFAMLDTIYRDQREVMRMGALVSPLIAVQNISMAFSGTDNQHVQFFDTQAEAERQRVVLALNHQVTVNGSNPDYKADSSLWSKFDVFKPQPVPMGMVLRNIWPDLLILFAWMLAAMLLLRAAGRRLVREMTR